MKPLKTSSYLLLLGLFFIAISCPSLSKAANITQTIETVKVDVQKLSTGFRVSKLIGSSVVNNANDTIGKIDDLIVSPDDNKSAYVIISVGGWLGMGTHLIALPYDLLLITNTKIILAGATKDGLKNLPEFKYNTL